MILAFGSPADKFEEALKGFEGHEHEYGVCDRDGSSVAWEVCPKRAAVRAAHREAVEEAVFVGKDAAVAGRFAAEQRGYAAGVAEMAKRTRHWIDGRTLGYPQSDLRDLYEWLAARAGGEKS